MNIKEAVKKFLINNVLSDKDSEELTYQTPLVSSGLIDSITTLQLVTFIENEFNIEFESHEVDQDNLNTIDIIEEFVVGKQRERSGEAAI